MNKQIFTIGYEIPGNSDDYLDFYETSSLMDADVLLISPNILRPRGHWVEFTRGGGGCYDVEASKEYKQKMSRLRKEIADHLRSGKNVFVFLTPKEDEYLALGVTSPRKGENNYSTETYSNYNFLPIDIGTLVSASGKHIKFSGYEIFSDFNTKFKDKLEYQLYIENPHEAQVVFTGKDSSKVLGAIYKFGSGHLITLPTLPFNEGDFTEITKDKSGKKQTVWNKKGMAFGSSLVKCLLDIDAKLTSNSDKTPTPDWASKKEFLSAKEAQLRSSIKANVEEITRIEQENVALDLELKEEAELKDLLFEQGKPLENAVIKALRILGYQAENYDDGDLEMDQVITSPENHRYIGECEGKENRAVDVTKFRQLVDALNADYARDEIDERAFGILFGNAERLKDPEERTVDFTTKCKTGAARENIALVKTTDLFNVVKYLNENSDETFKKSCRDAIHQHLGKDVIFPAIPS